MAILDSYAYLTRVAKEPFSNLAPDVVKTIKHHLAPVHCRCGRVACFINGTMSSYHSPRPMLCKGMNSSELGAWAKDNDREDMLLHADCVGACEELDRRRIEFDKKVEEGYSFLRNVPWNSIPPWFQEELCGAQGAVENPENRGDYTADELVANWVDRWKTTMQLIELGNEVDARAFWDQLDRMPWPLPIQGPPCYYREANLLYRRALYRQYRPL